MIDSTQVSMGVHHATLYVTTEPEAVVATLKELHTNGEPEVILVPSLTIAEARRLVERSWQKPDHAEYRLFIIATRKVAVDAQQTLLKILEEPPATTRFAFVIPPEIVLLPTVLSRLYQHPPIIGTELNHEFSSFLASCVGDRLAEITAIAKRKDDEAYALLERGLFQYMMTVPTVREKNELATYARYIAGPGAAKKMVWEAIALSLPVVRPTGK